MRFLPRRPYILYKYTDACTRAEEKCIEEKRGAESTPKAKIKEILIFKGQNKTQLC